MVVGWGGGVVASYPLLSLAPTQVEVEVELRLRLSWAVTTYNQYVTTFFVPASLKTNSKIFTEPENEKQTYCIYDLVNFCWHKRGDDTCQINIC